MEKKEVSLKKGYKYRIYPTKQQEEQLSQLFGCCRYVYNKLLEENKTAYELYKTTKDKVHLKNLSGFALVNRLISLKNNPETLWLKDVCSQSLQASALNLGNAYTNFFKTNKGYPKFKKKFGRQSAEFSNHTSIIRDSKLVLGRFKEPIKVKWSRPLPTGKRTACTITKEPSGKYYASFLVEVDKIVTTGKGFLGIDAGLTDLVTLSDGTSLPNPRHYVKSQKRLACLQRRLSRKQKGSKNRNKARLKVARLHESIANQRRDYLHKLSTRIVRNNQAVCIESLKVKNMVRNHRLAKHIADAGWGMFRTMLTYKTVHSSGCKLYLADPYYPSTQLCSSCLKKPETKLKLGTRKWICLHCGTLHQRDHNASLNLLHLAKDEHKIFKDHEKSVFILGPYQ